MILPAPEIIPAFPPIAPVISPIKKVAYNPTIGSTPATKEKVTDSGIYIIATVIPESSSTLRALKLCL